MKTHYDDERLESDSSPHPRGRGPGKRSRAKKNMCEALESVHKASPDPKWVVAVGECACTGSIFRGSYACVGAESEVLPVDLKIRGCRPPPIEILGGLLAMLQKSVA